MCRMATKSYLTLDPSESVRRSNETIAMAPKAGNITLLTRRLFNILLFCSQKDGPKEVYRRPLGQIMSHARFSSNNTEILKEHLKLMRSINVEWNSSSNEEKRWGVSGIIADVEIIETIGIGTFIEWSLPPKLRERLLNPDVYTTFDLEAHSILRTGSSIALYEICARYVTNPTRVTNRNTWEWWRPRLTGSIDDENSKHEYKYFKRDVLKPAILQINLLKKFQIELIEHKEGKWVKEIQFAISPEVSKISEAEAFVAIDGEVLEQIIRIGFSQMDAKKYFNEYDTEYLKATLDMLHKRMGNTALPKIQSPVAWFKDAILKKYVTPNDLVAKPLKAELKPSVSKRDLLMQEFNLQKQEDALKCFKELNSNEQEDLLSQCFTDAVGTMIKGEYKRRGLKSKIAESTFSTWYANKLWGDPTTEELLEFSMKDKK